MRQGPFWKPRCPFHELIHDLVKRTFGEDFGNLLVQQTPARKVLGKLFVGDQARFQLRQFVGVDRAVQIATEQIIVCRVIET